MSAVPRRVLLANHTPVVGSGSGAYTLAIANQLAARGFAPVIWTPGPGDGEAHDGGVRVVTTRLHLPGAPPGAFPSFTGHPASPLLYRDLTAAGWDAYRATLRAQLDAVAAATGAELVHAQHLFAIAEATNDLGLPTLATCHGSALSLVDDPRFGPTVRAAARSAARVVVVSRHVGARVREALAVPVEHIAVIPNGHDAGFRRVGPAEARGAHPRVVAVGRMVRYKRFDVLIDAVGALGDRAPELVLVGDGPLRAELEARARGLGRVRFTGWLGADALARWLRGADAVAVPSEQEPFGLVAVEALACGAPVIATDEGGLREIVTAEVGALVQGHGVAGWADALAAVTPPSEALRARAAARAAAFSWGDAATATVAAYDATLAAASGGPTLDVASDGDEAALLTRLRALVADHPPETHLRLVPPRPLPAALRWFLAVRTVAARVEALPALPPTAWAGRVARVIATVLDRPVPRGGGPDALDDVEALDDIVDALLRPPWLAPDEELDLGSRAAPEALEDALATLLGAVVRPLRRPPPTLVRDADGPALVAPTLRWDLGALVADRARFGTNARIGERVRSDLAAIRAELGADVAMTGSRRLPADRLVWRAPPALNEDERGWREAFDGALDALGWSRAASPSRPLAVAPERLARWHADLLRLAELARAVSGRGEPAVAAGRLEWLRDEPVAPRVPPILRPDTIPTAAGLMVCELNLDSAIGGPIQVALLRSWHAGAGALEGPDPRAALTRYVVDALAATGPPPWRLAVVVLEGAHPDGCYEAGQLAGALGDHPDLEVRCLAPEELRRVDDTLVDDAGVVHGLLRRAGPYHEGAGPVLALLREASRTRCVVLSDPRDLRVDDKLALADLHAAATAGDAALSPADRALVLRRVPWTRRLDAAGPEDTAALRAQLVAERRSLVLKRSASHRSHHVYCGVDTPEDTWRGLLDRAWGDSIPWLVQRVIEAAPTKLDFPTPDGGTRREERRVVISPLIFGAHFGGAVVRVIDPADPGVVPTLPKGFAVVTPAAHSGS